MGGCCLGHLAWCGLVEKYPTAGQAIFFFFFLNFGLLVVKKDFFL
jgi:hypothetical protein